MTSDAKAPVPDAPPQAREASPIGPVAGPPLAWFRASQERVYREVETTSRAWLARQEEAARSAFDVIVRTTCNGGDPARAMGAILDWQHGSFRRMACDMQHWAGFWSRCAAAAPAPVEGGGHDVRARHAPATLPEPQPEPDPP